MYFKLLRYLFCKSTVLARFYFKLFNTKHTQWWVSLYKYFNLMQCLFQPNSETWSEKRFRKIPKQTIWSEWEDGNFWKWKVSWDQNQAKYSQKLSDYRGVVGQQIILLKSGTIWDDPFPYYVWVSIQKIRTLRVGIKHPQTMWTENKKVKGAPPNILYILGLKIYYNKPEWLFDATGSP